MRLGDERAAHSIPIRAVTMEGIICCVEREACEDITLFSRAWQTGAMLISS